MSGDKRGLDWLTALWPVRVATLMCGIAPTWTFLSRPSLREWTRDHSGWVAGGFLLLVLGLLVAVQHLGAALRRARNATRSAEAKIADAENSRDFAQARALREMEAARREIEHLRRTPSPRDVEQFKLFETALPSDSGAIAFLRHHWYRGSFDGAQIEPIEDYAIVGALPNAEFLDQQVEHARDRFHAATVAFADYIPSIIFPVDNAPPDRYSIPREWEREQPDRYHDALATSRKVVNEVLSSHDNLIRTARHRGL